MPVVVQTSTKRPIDKNLVNVNIAALANTQQNISLITATFPSTITGVRWSICLQSNVGQVANQGGWALIRVKDGVAPNTMSFTNGATFLEPEQEVIAFGRWAVQADAVATSTGPSIHRFEGSTKSMRKLMGGDQIYFCVNGATAGTVNTIATIQFFAKT